jgi:biopolymer transport protein ExbD
MAQVSSGGGGCEPNLIPLLDLVLQMVMFFIMVANFAQQDANNSDVILPTASSARPSDAPEGDFVFLNLNQEGKVVLSTGDKPLESLSEVKYHMMSQYTTAKRAADNRGDKEVKTVVIIRAHKDADFRPIFEVLREAKSAGFKKWQLKAITKSTPGA